VEQDADLIMFIHRERENDRSPQDNQGEKYPPIEAELIIAKQRNGPVGTVKVLFFPAYTRFEALDKNA
jgi:replicative DNA helicase